MMAYIGKIIPILATATSIVCALVFLFKRNKSLLQKAILWSTPFVILLQIGTFLLVNYQSEMSLLLGGRIVLVALCVLTPASTIAALLWGEIRFRDLTLKSKITLSSQALFALFFLGWIPSGVFLQIADAGENGLSLVYSQVGQFFLIYLVMSSVFVLSIFERKLRLYGAAKGVRTPTIVLMGIFVFFIIGASQGLLVRTLSTELLLMVSFSIFLGYLTPLSLRYGRSTTPATISDNRQTVYSSFVIFVVGAYLIFIGLVGKLMALIGGNVQAFFTSIAAVVIVLILFMSITSLSLQDKFRRFIDRTFYGGKFDYRAIWSRFADETLFVLGLDDLTDSILTTISDILQAKGGAILLKDGNSSSLRLVKKKILLTMAR